MLAKLAELLPYLGRADSICEARLLDNDRVPDESWWRPGADGDRTTRLLASARPVRRAVLEMSTVQVRKSRRTVPPETIWVSYAADPPAAPPPTARRRADTVEAIRFFVAGRVPLKSVHGILLADDVHRRVGDRLAAAGVPDARRQVILGSRGATSDHEHAHWIPSVR